jgi:hypothetical protein
LSIAQISYKTIFSKKDKSKMIPVQIQVEGDTIDQSYVMDIDGPKSYKLKKCSELVSQLLDEREELDPDNEEPIQILVSGQGFAANEIKIAFAYMEHYDFNLPDYGKIISTDIRKNCHDEYDATLANSYNLENIKILHSCATFFQIRSLTRLCYIRIGCEVFMNTNESGAVQKMMDKFKIEHAYTIHTEQSLKNQYPFLKGTIEKNIYNS